MLSSEERMKQICYRDPVHILQGCKERGKKLWKHHNANDMMTDWESRIKDPMKSVIVPDTRKNVASNYICMFITDAGGFVALPCLITEEKIFVLTVKDILEDNAPLWFINEYNRVAKSKGMTTMAYTIRI